MLILGITGPTGSGKTTALQRIAARGGCILDLDAVYHQLLATNQDLIRALDAQRTSGKAIFGSALLLTEKAAAEKAAATVWELSERERAIQRAMEEKI